MGTPASLGRGQGPSNQGQAKLPVSWKVLVDISDFPGGLQRGPGQILWWVRMGKFFPLGLSSLSCSLRRTTLTWQGHVRVRTEQGSSSLNSDNAGN